MSTLFFIFLRHIDYINTDKDWILLIAFMFCDFLLLVLSQDLKSFRNLP